MVRKFRIITEILGDPLERPFRTTVEYIVAEGLCESVSTIVNESATADEQRAYVLGVKAASYFAGILVDDPILVEASSQQQLPFVVVGNE